MANQDIPPTLGADIRSAISDLDKIRTPHNRDSIVWVQYVLTACAMMIGEPAFEITKKAG
ncbi:MAG: hypothetical protein HDR82_09480 [Bacteroides sp.]|nr:hypothetical protein [Bacteroides sp.]